MPGALLAAGTTSLQRAAPIAGSAYTVTFYMRIDANPGDQREIWVARNTGGSQFEGLEIRSTGVIRFLYVDGAGWSQLNTFVTMSLDTWWAFGITRDGDDLYCYAREDGGSTQSWTVNTSQASRGAWADLNWQLPSIDHNEDTGFQLTRLFDATMDQTAIEAEWDSETPVNTTDLVADWEFANDTTDATRRNDAFDTYDLSGTGDADWGATDLPLVFASAPTFEVAISQGATVSAELLVTRQLSASIDQTLVVAGELLVGRELTASIETGLTVAAEAEVERLLAASVDVPSEVSADLLVSRLLGASITFPATVVGDLTVSRLLSAAVDLGVSAEAELLVERLLTVAVAAGADVDADLTVSRLLSVSMTQALEVAAQLTVDEPGAPDFAAAIQFAMGVAVELTVARLLSADVTIGLAVAAALLGAETASLSYQTQSVAADTMARSVAVDTNPISAAADTQARSLAA